LFLYKGGAGAPAGWGGYISSCWIFWEVLEC